MIFVDVNGGTKYQRQLVEEVVYFCLDKLLPRHRVSDIVGDLVNIKSDAIGYGMEHDEREYELEIDKKLCDEELVKCVCHEMVHVKQGVLKEKEDGIKGGLARWKGEVVHWDVGYYNLPWEIEAYAMEGDLADEYFRTA